MKRSKHSLSHYRLFTGDMGELIPCGLTEVLPGDTIQQATSCLVRLSPLVSPVMHPVHVRVHHWFVPHRLVWDSWEDFITGGPSGDDTSAFPVISSGGSGFSIGSLADYLGVPTDVPNLEVSALPFRAYKLIFNEWYRDQDLTTAASLSKSDGLDTTTSLFLNFSAWEKDYFTTSRPWEQKGTEVTLPLGTEARVRTDPSQVNDILGSGNAALRFRNTADGGITAGTYNLQTSDGTVNRAGSASGSAGSNQYPANLYADLSAATAATINDLREAFAIQRYKENRARYGSRFTEYLASAFGVRSSDARLQRPEYLGGGRQTIQFSEVLQTAPEAGDGVGNMRGHGIGAMRSNRYRKFFEEHGYIVSLMSVLPKTMYMDGLARHWNRRIKEDFFQRELQHLGQQAVLNKEVYAAHGSPDGVFGYQDRYDEYRRSESYVSGEFRDTLDYWHFARKFGSAPALNTNFVTSSPTKRTFQSTESDGLWIMANHSIQARRLVMKTARPSIM